MYCTSCALACTSLISCDFHSAFLDPVCYSSFSPSAGINAFRIALSSAEGEQRNTALFCLTPGEVI